MTKYRAKPVVVEAEQFTKPKGATFADMFMGFPVRLDDDDEEGHYLIIPTLGGDQIVDEGDWIIKGIKGELYPCKSDIFEQTYERVEDNGGRRSRNEQRQD